MSLDHQHHVRYDAPFDKAIAQPVPGTPEYGDFVACRKARIAVAESVARNTAGHLRYQELCSVAAFLSDELETNRRLRVAVNPIRAWAIFETSLFLDGTVAPPTDVLFFPLGNKIHAAALGCEVVERVRELAGFGPCTIDEWQMTLESFGAPYAVRRQELIDLCRQLAAMGVLAFL